MEPTVESKGARDMTQKKADNSAENVEAAMDRVRQLSDKVLEQAQQNGLAWLEGYERMLKSVLDFEEQAAKGSGQEWVSQLATIHANFVRETSEMVFATLRQQANR